MYLNWFDIDSMIPNLLYKNNEIYRNNGLWLIRFKLCQLITAIKLGNYQNIQYIKLNRHVNYNQSYLIGYFKKVE